MRGLHRRVRRVPELVRSRVVRRACPRRTTTRSDSSRRGRTRATARRRCDASSTSRRDARRREAGRCRGAGAGSGRGRATGASARRVVVRRSRGGVRRIERIRAVGARAQDSRNDANGGFGAKVALDGDDVDVAGVGVFDAEFLFIANDEVVDVRVAQRGGNAENRGVFRLSYTDGVAFDTNLARARAEELRIAIGWEILPVIAAFDPKWSDKERLWFEKLFDAAAGRPAPETDDLRDMRDTYSYE